MLKHYWLTILFVYLTFNAFSQSDTIKILEEKLANATSDSIRIANYLEQSDYYLKVDKKRAKSFAVKALQLANANKNFYLAARSLLAVANAERFTNNINIFLSDETKAIVYANKTNNNKLLFDCLNVYAYDLITLTRLDDAAIVLNKEKSLPANLFSNLNYKAKLLNTQGYYLLKQQKFMADAKAVLNESLALANESEDFYLVAKNKLFLFRAMLFSGMRDSTANYGFDALNYFQKNNYPEEAANCYIEIANNYRFLADMNKSNEYSNEAYAIMTAHENNLGAAAAQSILFQNHYLQQQITEAATATDLLSYHYKRLNYEIGIGTATVYYAAICSAKGEYTKADTLFKKSEDIANKLNLPALKLVIFMFESLHLQAQKKTKEADSVALKGYALAQQTMPKELLKNVYSANDSNTKLSESQALDKRLFNDSNFRTLHGKEALESLRTESKSDNIYKPVLSAFDSGLTSAYSKQLTELETKYKTKLIDDSLRIANQNVLLAQSTVKKQNIMLIATALIAALLFAGFGLQYQSRKRAESDKAKIELLQGEINHRITNNLAIVKRFAEIADKADKKTLPLASLQSRINAIELLHKNLYQSAKAGIISLQQYVSDLTAAIQSTYTDENKQINIQVHTPVNANMQTAEKLGLIINELMTNSFKYAFANSNTGQINIIAKEINSKSFQLQYKDSGIGFNKENTAKGYGSKLIEGIAHELNASYNYQTGNGVVFTIII